MEKQQLAINRGVWGDMSMYLEKTQPSYNNQAIVAYCLTLLVYYPRTPP